SRVPGVVFPECENAAGAERTQDMFKSGGALARKDVVEDGTHVRQINIARRLAIRDQLKITVLAKTLAANLQALSGNIDAEQRARLKYFLQQRNRRARPAAEIHDAFGGKLHGAEMACEKLDPPPRKIALVLAGQRETAVHERVVFSGVLVEVRFGGHEGFLDAFSFARHLVPSPPYSGERVRVRGNSASGATRDNGPSPQPYPPSTGEREQETNVPLQLSRSRPRRAGDVQDAIPDFRPEIPAHFGRGMCRTIRICG